MHSRPTRAFWLAAALLCSSPALADDWSQKTSDHFIVFYKKDENFASQVARYAEIYYARVASDLGYQRYSNFWQWENRAKVFIYSNAEEFRRATGEEAWSQGVAVYSRKEIHSFIGNQGFLESILPHEITHLVFRDFIGFKSAVPVWLDEGVAQWEEPAKRALAKRVALQLIKGGKDLAVQDLTATNVRLLGDEQKIHFFYMQSVSLVDFLVTTYGTQAFTEFCQELRDGRPFEKAMHLAFKNIENLDEFDTKWRKYVAGEPSPSDIEVYVTAE